TWAQAFNVRRNDRFYLADRRGSNLADRDIELNVEILRKLVDQFLPGANPDTWRNRRSPGALKDHAMRLMQSSLWSPKSRAALSSHFRHALRRRRTAAPLFDMRLVVDELHVGVRFVRIDDHNCVHRRSS